MNSPRVKMECDVCGYKSFPQWFNDKAHCLKCDAMLAVRPTCQQRPSTTGSVVRRLSNAGMSREAAGSAMESHSGICEHAPDGVHHWKFGKCCHCHKAEGQSKQVDDCRNGGRCVFKFARCIHCGCKEGLGDCTRAASPAVDRTSSDGSELPVERRHTISGEHIRRPSMDAPVGRPRRHSISGSTPDRRDSLSTSTVLVPTPPAQPTVVATEVRERQECHKCGYACVPQWMNGEARCLKCGELLLTTRRPSSRCAVRQPAGSAMESESGQCDKSPNGLHHWKFGKCAHCQKAQGHFVRDRGCTVNPAGVECPSGGKCLFKFAMCTKCGRGEAGVSVERRPSSRARRHSGTILPADVPRIVLPEEKCDDLSGSVPVGGGLRAVRKLLSGHDSEADTVSTTASDAESTASERMACLAKSR